jgi:hypothetical protein
MNLEGRDAPRECGVGFDGPGRAWACGENTVGFLSDGSGNFECGGCRCS